MLELVEGAVYTASVKIQHRLSLVWS